MLEIFITLMMDFPIALRKDMQTRIIYAPVRLRMICLCRIYFDIYQNSWMPFCPFLLIFFYIFIQMSYTFITEHKDQLLFDKAGATSKDVDRWGYILLLG